MIDFMPDFLPTGLVDDSAIILWVLNVTGDELARYKRAMLKNHPSRAKENE